MADYLDTTTRAALFATITSPTSTKLQIYDAAKKIQAHCNEAEKRLLSALDPVIDLLAQRFDAMAPVQHTDGTISNMSELATDLRNIRSTLIG